MAWPYNRETVLLLSDEDQTTPQNGMRVLWDVHVAPRKWPGGKRGAATWGPLFLTAMERSG
jgi:hypothetical protein